MSLQSQQFPNGLTVRELKEIIKDWPEVGPDGEELTVWKVTGRNLSSVVTEVITLNVRIDNSVKSADLLLE